MRVVKQTGQRGNIKGTRLQSAGKNGAGELGLTMKVIRGLGKMEKWMKYTRAGGMLRVPVDE